MSRPIGGHDTRARARDLGIVPAPGVTGAANAITDVPGILVGQVTIRSEPDIHSGVTAVVPEGIGPDASLPAGVHSGNGFGKLIGYTQLVELGRIESPIVLTSTLSAFRAADAVVEWMLTDPRWNDVTTFNPVVGECNDGHLSDIRSRPVQTRHVLEALASARSGQVRQGAVGAGTGTIALGFKAGIGTASRSVAIAEHRFTIGGLVQANFGGRLRIGGRIIEPPHPPARDAGSCMLVIATDAPLESRQLTRLATRAVYGLGRVGAEYRHGSGDYGIAVTTNPRTPLTDDQLDPFITAVLDLTEEMVLDALIAADATRGFRGRFASALTDTPWWRSLNTP